MATLQAYGAWGMGLRIAATGPLTGIGRESTFVSSTYLGNFTYLERYNYDSGPITSFAVIIYDGMMEDFARVATYFIGEQKAFELRDMNLSISEFAIGGIEALLSLNDKIIGNNFTDRIIGFTGNDSIWGSGGNDTLSGGSGNDYLSGGAGNDYIYGGVDNDRLAGGIGNDTLSGSTGADRFIYNSTDGADVINGYRDGIDRIEIKSGAERFSQVRVTDSGADTIIRFGTVKIALDDVDHRLIGSTDFIFT